MNKKTVQAMLGPCEACGAPASDMCGCCLGCHRLQQRLAEVERERDEAQRNYETWATDAFERKLQVEDLDNELSQVKWKLTAAQQDVARLREALKAIADGSTNRWERDRARSALDACEEKP